VDGTALAAAGDNARWCDRVCRAHRVPTTRTRDVWAALRRPPARYPDAVTLRRGVPSADVLALVDDTPDCSVKDSFCDLDLTPSGFEVLFDARWISAQPPTTRAPATGWSLVGTEQELRAWAAAAGTGGTFGPELLADPAVGFLVARRDGAVVAGAIAHRGGPVVGVSNVFSTTMEPDAAWAGIVATVGASHPGLALVGYERAADLPPALRAGFTEAGALRVWVRSGGPAQA